MLCAVSPLKCGDVLLSFYRHRLSLHAVAHPTPSCPHFGMRVNMTRFGLNILSPSSILPRKSSTNSICIFTPYLYKVVPLFVHVILLKSECTKEFSLCPASHCTLAYIKLWWYIMSHMICQALFPERSLWHCFLFRASPPDDGWACCYGCFAQLFFAVRQWYTRTIHCDTFAINVSRALDNVYCLG